MLTPRPAPMGVFYRLTYVSGGVKLQSMKNIVDILLSSRWRFVA